MTPNWVKDAVFYHIYPLGFCECPLQNPEFSGNADSPTTTEKHTIDKVLDWIPHLKELGVNAIYFGPVFQSTLHGYDTADYKKIDSRLGTNAMFKNVCDRLHAEGIRVILDGVFNHVGRNFWAFEDLKKNLSSSHYINWFSGVDFNNRSPEGDNFSYESWQGHFSLVKLNLRNNPTVEHLLECVKYWIDEFGIDGLRLDAADCIDHDFFKRLRQYSKNIRSDFWLMGEIIHGDYRTWANGEMLDSVTNYECHKGIYSSHNTNNYFEIAYSLNRQFGNGGIYKDLCLYNFVDNHDVNRLSSLLNNDMYLENCYTLLYCMPGVPSIYYGSEWGIKGERSNTSDAALRPALNLQDVNKGPLLDHISKLADIRSALPALKQGNYEQVVVRNEQFIFKRATNEQIVYCALNLTPNPADIEFPCGGNQLFDHLHGEAVWPINGGKAKITIQPFSGMILSEQKTNTHVTNTVSQPQEHHEHHEPTQHVDNQAEKREIVVGGKYHHFKGRDYVVLQVGRHSETLEELVVYQELEDQRHIWIRPVWMFLEDVNDFGNIKPRFYYTGNV